jgi:DNA (cytosine-5)-methyltransferase 1
MVKNLINEEQEIIIDKNIKDIIEKPKKKKKEVVVEKPKKKEIIIEEKDEEIVIEKPKKKKKEIIIDNEIIIDEQDEEIVIEKPKKKKKEIIIEENNEENIIQENPKKSTSEDENPKQKINVLDLFCGCVGMSKGLTSAGLNIIAGIDIWDKAINSYKKNFKHEAICADLTKLSPESFQKLYNKNNLPIDVIVGGPPCQGFSMAGRRNIDDPRNSLFMEYLKYLNFFKPKMFLMENVIGILSMKTSENEKVIDIITNLLTKNYNIIICKLYASDFGVPQNRRRVIIIGIRKDLKLKPSEPEPTIKKIEDRVPVKTILLPMKSIEASYFLSKKALEGIKAKKEKAKLNKNGFGAQYLDLNKPSFTIPARYWKDGYDALVKYTDDKIRRLTILELQRIQSFPDDYKFEGSKKDIIMQIGNAVACKFAKELGLYIINIFKQI